jgi:hypothetical protein
VLDTAKALPMMKRVPPKQIRATSAAWTFLECKITGCFRERFAARESWGSHAVCRRLCPIVAFSGSA